MPTIKGYRQASELSGAIELGSEKVISRYSLEFIVIADNASQGPLTIRETAGLPQVGLDTYTYNGESDTSAVCKRKTPRNEPKQPLVWYVKCDFDNDPTSQSQENESDAGSATARPPIIEWDAEFGEEVLYYDFSSPDRLPILNPVGHQFDPPVTRRVIYPVLTVERYQTVFLASTILAYTDHINSNAFYGADPGHALMTNIRAREVIEDATKLWQVTYRIRFAVSPDGFDLMPLNQGTHYWDNVLTKNLIPFIEGQVPYVGKLLSTGIDGTGEPPEFSRFKPYPEADFDALFL
jgi:hypothetical protein